ncbi:MAG: DUF951 domain-containing protein [Chloroflexi bacterium]|nr:DUF951 domain-containing protein [Chloroflexota bacterium]
MAKDYKLGDTLTLKKAHPCGGLQWKVTRIGADVKIQCITCERTVLLTRSELEKRTRNTIV